MQPTNHHESAALAQASESGAAIAAILDLAFPGMAGGGAGRQAFSTERARALAAEYVAAQFPQHRCAVLFGSYAKGQQKLYSDLDVLVVLPAGEVTEKRRLIYRECAMELFVVTERTILEALALSKRIGLRVFFDALEQGIVLSDPGGLAGKLQALGRREFAKSAGAPDVAAMTQFRVHITQNLLKLANMKDVLDQIHLAALLYNSISFAILRAETGWAYRNERLPREFSAHDPHWSQALHAGLVALGAGLGSGEFIRVGGALLDRLGGPLWDGTSEPMFKLSDGPSS